MALSYSPQIVTNGLVMYLDAANRKSTINAAPTPVLSSSGWATGSGGISGFSQNGSTVENERIYATDPWGNSSIVWEARPTSTTDADGGWNSDFFAIDRTKLYRFSVWVRRTSSSSGGTFYLGTGAGGQEVMRTDNGAEQGNPYWECEGTGVLEQNVWYLVCGHIYPFNTTYTGRHPDTGFFTIANGPTKVRDVNGCNIGNDLKWAPGSTSALHRTYLYYCSDSTTRLQFAFPRVDICDGNEPSINELLNNGASVWKDLTGNGYNGAFVNSPGWSNRTFQFNASNYIDVNNLNLSASAYTIMGAARYTGGTRGRIINGRYNNWLMGHWSSSTENYYAVGWVSSVGTGANDTNWRIYASTWGYTNNAASLFVNGVRTAGPNSGASAGPNGIRIGEYGLGGEPSTGECAFVIAYNRVLSDEEILQNYNALRARYSL